MPPKLPQSPIQHLIKSNNPPNEREEALIRLKIDEMLNERSLVKPKSAPCMDLQLDVTLQQYYSVLSCIRYIPTEILQEIYLYCIPTTDVVESSFTPLGIIPWYLGQICGRWRKIALNTPTLWGTIAPGDLLTITPRQQSVVRELLRRSAAAPLRVFVDMRGNPQNEIVACLAQESERWEYANIRLKFSVFITLESIRGHLPLLNTLKLQCSPFPLLGSSNIFEITPRLRSISLGGIDPSQLKLPWTQLSSYEEQVVQNHGLLPSPANLNFIATLSTLTSLSLTWNSILLSPLILQKLEELRIELNQYGASAARSLGLLILPSILRISFSGGAASQVEALVEIVSNSGNNRTDGCCPLEHLECLYTSSIPLGAGILATLLQSTPNLKTMHTSLPSAIDLMEIATCRAQRLLPRLRKCHLSLSTAHIFRTPYIEDVNKLVSPQSSLVDGRLGLCFTPAEYGHTLHFKVNGYRETSGYTTLFNIKTELYNLYPVFQKVHQKRPLKVLDKKSVQRAWDILNELEALDICEKEEEDLYHSGLPLLLKRISESTIVTLEACMREKMEMIMTKWNVLLKKSLHLRRWVFCGLYEVVYVPHDDEIRNSDWALDLAYELRSTSLTNNFSFSY